MPAEDPRPLRGTAGDRGTHSTAPALDARLGERDGVTTRRPEPPRAPSGVFVAEFGNQDHAGGGVQRRQAQHRRHPEDSVADAGAAQPIAVSPDRQRRATREDRVEVADLQHRWPVPVPPGEGSDQVAERVRLDGEPDPVVEARDGPGAHPFGVGTAGICSVRSRMRGTAPSAAARAPTTRPAKGTAEMPAASPMGVQSSRSGNGPGFGAGERSGGEDGSGVQHPARGRRHRPRAAIGGSRAKAVASIPPPAMPSRVVRLGVQPRAPRRRKTGVGAAVARRRP